ncbi:MAG: CGNR zinc finger domain-containing protein [Thermomicrobiales bacterium]
MTRQGTNLLQLRLLGGRLCLDFVNTIENRAGRTPEDFLTSYPDLVRWGRHAGLYTATAEAEARAVLERAFALRDALYRVFHAIALSRDPERTDLDYLQRAYADAMSMATLTRGEEGFAWDWQPGGPHLDQLLWPIAHSAIDLLTTGNLHRIKVCANPHGCGWLFYDGSKNGSRRWCSMEGCGSQVKMRRLYAKRRATAST